MIKDNIATVAAAPSSVFEWSDKLMRHESSECDTETQSSRSSARWLQSNERAIGMMVTIVTGVRNDISSGGGFKRFVFS